MEAVVVSGSPRSQGPGIPELLVVVVISKTLVTSCHQKDVFGKRKRAGAAPGARCTFACEPREGIYGRETGSRA